jgi:DnaK suppressor protein
MTDTIHVTEEDDEVFMIQQEAIGSSLSAVRELLEKRSLTTICLECGEPIGEARLKALPSATLCIDCKELQDEGKL